MLLNYDVIKNTIFQEKYVKIQNFAIKDRIFTGFLLIKKEIGISNVTCKFQLHSMEIFFNHPTPTPELTAYPTPTFSGTPQISFVIMIAKDELEIT